MKRKLLIASTLSVAALVAWAYFGRTEAEAPVVRTAPVTRGAVVATVQATGRVEPVTTVTVGSQVSGVISWLGADFNSLVRAGEVIARLEPSLLQAQVEQAEANLTRVMADVRQREIGLADARAKLERADRLAASGLVSVTDLEAARLAVQVAETNVASVAAQVVQARAALNQARVNLQHSAIVAPIDGIVIERSVDVGQTVAASLSSPTIFLIAADLTEMRVSAAIDESDIAGIEPGQPVEVTVDAYPGVTFSGVVAQIRLQPQVVSNVTTYSTIVDVANDELKLKPGMTASVTVETARRDNVLRVPAAALRFRPAADVLAAFGADTPRPGEPAASVALASGRGQASPAADAVRLGAPPARPAAEVASLGNLWVLENGALRALTVRVGLSDGAHVEIVGADLEPGSEVVTGITLPGQQTAATGGTSSLFTGSSGRQGLGRGGAVR